MTQGELHKRGLTDSDLERRYMAAFGSEIVIDRQNPDSSQARQARSNAYDTLVIHDTAIVADTSDLPPSEPLGAFAADSPEIHRSFKSK